MQEGACTARVGTGGSPSFATIHISRRQNRMDFSRKQRRHAVWKASGEWNLRWFNRHHGLY
jgi:hypothetical protein